MFPTRSGTLPASRPVSTSHLPPALPGREHSCRTAVPSSVIPDYPRLVDEPATGPSPATLACSTWCCWLRTNASTFNCPIRTRFSSGDEGILVTQQCHRLAGQYFRQERVPACESLTELGLV